MTFSRPFALFRVIYRDEHGVWHIGMTMNREEARAYVAQIRETLAVRAWIVAHEYASAFVREHSERRVAK